MCSHFCFIIYLHVKLLPVFWVCIVPAKKKKKSVWWSERTICSSICMFNAKSILFLYKEISQWDTYCCIVVMFVGGNPCLQRRFHGDDGVSISDSSDEVHCTNTDIKIHFIRFWLDDYIYDMGHYVCVNVRFSCS